MEENKSQFFNTREEIGRWLGKNYIKNYIINDDLSVDVGGDIDIYGKNLKIIPVDFNNVIGNFICGDNKLTTLIGAPKIVGGSFLCQNNKLTNLVGAPEFVGGSFNCSDNQLKNLVDSPRSVGVHFVCDKNQLTTILGVPKTIGGDFWCDNKIVDFTDFLKTNIGGMVTLGLNEEIFNFNNKALFKFFYKYDNKRNCRVEIEFKILKLYLEKLELEKNLKISHNIKSNKTTNNSYL